MRRRAFVPSVPNTLEERITPSHSGLRGVVSTLPAIRQSLDPYLYGFALGQETTRGTVHLLRSSDAAISPLGKVSLIGYLVIPLRGGATRAAQGIVFIATAKGEMTVALEGTVTLSSGSVPSISGNLTYKIVAAIKAYRGATGTGPVLFGTGPVVLPGRFLLDFGNYIPPP